MKGNVIKIIIAIALAVLIGLITYTIASDIDYRNWITLVVTIVTTALSLIFAMGIDSNYGYRTANIKVVSAIGTFVVLIGNIVFSCFDTYNIPIYIAIMGIISLLLFTLTYSLIPKENKVNSEEETTAKPNENK